jgi:hypothetical protein
MKRIALFLGTMAFANVGHTTGTVDIAGRQLFRAGVPQYHGSPPALERYARLSTSAPAQGGGFGFGPWSAVAVGSWPDAIAIGDVTGDGLNDVVLTTTYYFDPENDYQVFVFAQQPDGTLGAPEKWSYTATATRTGLELTDLNGDGILDIAVGHGTGVTILLADGTGDFTTEVVTAPRASDTLTNADVDLDGIPDLIGLSWSAGAMIFYGNGSGGISSQELLATNAAGYNDQAIGDLNGDGVDDLAVMSGQLYAVPNLSVHLHDGVFGFLSPETYFVGENELTDGVAVGDINSDKRDDVVLSRGRNSPTYLWLYHQNEQGTLEGPTTIDSYDIPETVEVTDLDNDGMKDVVVLHGGWQKAGYYLQKAGGLSPEILVDIPYASHYSPEGLAVGDINDDGCPDMAIADYNQGLVTLLGQDCMQPQAFADLAAAVQISSAGRRKLYIGISAENLSPDQTATGSTISVDLAPLGEPLRRVELLSGNCTHGTDLHFDCSAGELAPGAQSAVRFRVQGRRSGSVRVDAVVSAQAPPDPDERNNAATATGSF